MRAVFHRQNQQGFTALGMMMLILTCTFLILSQMDKVLTHVAGTKQHLKRHFQTENEVLSALAWGQKQSWNAPTLNAQCRSYQSISVCLKLTQYESQIYSDIDSEQPIQWILLSATAPSLARFKLGMLDQKGQLHFKQSYWLDICPNKKGKNCD